MALSDLQYPEWEVFGEAAGCGVPMRFPAESWVPREQLQEGLDESLRQDSSLHHRI